MENLKNIILNKQHNIGSLCLYLRNRTYLIDELDDIIKDDLLLPQKIHKYLNPDINIKCDCGKMKKWKSFKYGWTKTCGDIDCIKKSKTETKIEKYGVDNPMKNINIKNKLKETVLKKYGFTSASKNEKVKEKIKNKLNNRPIEEKKITTIKKKENWKNKSDEEKNKIIIKRKKTNDNMSFEIKNIIKEKRKKTCNIKYNSDYAISSDEIRNKITDIFNDKFGGNSPFSDKKIKNKALETYKKNHIDYIKISIKKFDCDYISHIDKGNSNIEYTLLCKRNNAEFTIGYSNLRNRIISNLEISPYFRIIHGISNEEIQLHTFINKNYNGEIIKNSKSLINPLELDIYLPELNLAFEFNGLYWHNELHKENNYHLNKTVECEKQGNQLIHVWEDDWIYKQDIVKSMMLNKLNQTPNKIFARKTEVKEIIDNKLIREFLDKNHIQGFVGSKVKLGLFFDNDLVSLMTFGKRRVAMGKKLTNEDEYELLRFCNKLNTNVIGGASKLFKYFIRNYNPEEITTYADRSHSNGKLYEVLGFEFINKTQPNYYYIIDGIRKHRFNFRKDKLIKEGFDPNKTEHQIMLDRKIFRIYDSGNLKFIYTKK